MKKRHVVIIGGGLAGLSAAYTLVKTNRYTIELLEARDRLGGRVKTLGLDGKPVDIGGFIIMPWYKHFLNSETQKGMALPRLVNARWPFLLPLLIKLN